MIGTTFKAIVGNSTEWVVIGSHGMFSDTWKCYPADKDLKNIKDSLIQYFTTDFIKNNEIFGEDVQFIAQKTGQKKATIIDPPSGWMFGFPKPIPEERKKDVEGWLIEQGYPKKLIEDLGDHFYCRYWEENEVYDKE